MRRGNLVRGSNGGFPCGAVEVDGIRRDLAFGKERKPGQVCAVGGPVRAKICIVLVLYQGKGKKMTYL